MQQEQTQINLYEDLLTKVRGHKIKFFFLQRCPNAKKQKNEMKSKQTHRGKSIVAQKL